MGSGFSKRCPKCGFEFYSHNGVGFLFPKVYAETVQLAKSGKLGNEIQDFFKNHEDGVINTESVTLCCDRCGHLSNGKDLTMYVPKDNKPEKIKHGRWSVAMPYEGAKYVAPWDLKEGFEKYALYAHSCEKCGGEMRIVKDDEELLCPECKIPMETGHIIMWD
ncbi:MAG: hypothetical protein K6B28_07595 [Lachnospiraceae bacterium]|nr:hypothetical protein [Lachnospiraceae bacterium]